MSDAELEQIIGKVRKLKALHRARERAKQLERELRGVGLHRCLRPVVGPYFLRTSVPPVQPKIRRP